MGRCAVYQTPRATALHPEYFKRANLRKILVIDRFDQV